MGEAHIHELVGRPHHQEIGERHLLFAGDENELLGVWVKVKRVIVSEREEIVGVREQGVDCHEAEELIDVEVVGNLGTKLVLVGAVNEPREFHDALALLWRCRPLRLILRLVFLPIIAEVIDPAHALRLEQESVRCAESGFDEFLIHGLDDCVKAEERPVVPARDRERHVGESGARGGDSSRAKQPKRERFARFGRVERPSLQLDPFERMELSVRVAVEVNLEGPLQPGRRCHVRGIPRVADRNVLVGCSLHSERAVRPGKLHTEQIAFSLPRLARLRHLGWRRRSGERHGRRLHRLILVARNRDVDYPDLVQAKAPVVGRIRWHAGARRLIGSRVAGLESHKAAEKRRPDDRAHSAPQRPASHGALSQCPRGFRVDRIKRFGHGLFEPSDARAFVLSNQRNGMACCELNANRRNRLRRMAPVLRPTWLDNIVRTSRKPARSTKARALSDTPAGFLSRSPKSLDAAARKMSRACTVFSGLK